MLTEIAIVKMQIYNLYKMFLFCKHSASDYYLHFLTFCFYSSFCRQCLTVAISDTVSPLTTELKYNFIM